MLVSCHKFTAEETAKETLQEALEALSREDYDAYLRCVDFDTSLDSAQEAVMRDVLRQHLGWLRHERPAVMAVKMVDAEMHGDSVCMVYCQYVYADSTREVSWQKMVRHGEEWKIRWRN